MGSEAGAVVAPPRLDVDAGQRRPAHGGFDAMRTAQADSARFLDPDTLRRLQHLSITSRVLVEGSMTGSHRSPYKGLSTEFADHRQYVKGDDLKRLDWRVYARSERYYVKRYEENTNLKAYILVDCSASMGYKSNGVTKYEYACHLAAGLAYVVIKQQDSAGMVIFGERIEDYFPPRSSLSHLRSMLNALTACTPHQGTNTATALHGMAELIKRRGLIIVVSDLMDDPAAVVKGLAHFKQKRHDVIVLHVLDDSELNFPFDKVATFRDMETGEKVRVSPKDLKDDYSAELTAFINQYKRACFENNIDYVTINTKTPHSTFLSAYLSRREKVR
jgi:uncharacterized protein (DUF58 family)